MERYDIKELDNRDPNCTRIILDGLSTPGYIEIDPVELYQNMLENCYPGLDQLIKLTVLGYTTWDDIYEWAVEDYKNRLDDLSQEEAERLKTYVDAYYFGTE